MTKGEGSAHLSSCYKGLREPYAKREVNDPSIHITNCRGRNKSTLCHPAAELGNGTLKEKPHFWREMGLSFLDVEWG